MPSVKSIPIRNPDGQVIGQRFEASEEFKRHAAERMVPMVRSDGRTVRVNRKLASNGHYADRGFTEPKSKAKEDAGK
jgi:hypothetical protein